MPKPSGTITSSILLLYGTIINCPPLAPSGTTTRKRIGVAVSSFNFLNLSSMTRNSSIASCSCLNLSCRRIHSCRLCLSSCNLLNLSCRRSHSSLSCLLLSFRSSLFFFSPSSCFFKRILPPFLFRVL